MEHWFVYYTVQADEVDPCIGRVRPMQRALAAATGVQARLMRRIDDAGAAATLMEVYAGITDAAVFATALTAALARGDVPAAARSGRRVERFVEV